MLLICGSHRPEMQRNWPATSPSGKSDQSVLARDFPHVPIAMSMLLHVERTSPWGSKSEEMPTSQPWSPQHVARGRCWQLPRWFNQSLRSFMFPKWWMMWVCQQEYVHVSSYLSVSLSVCPSVGLEEIIQKISNVPTIPKRVQNHQLSSQESERFGFLCTLAIFKVRMSHSSCSRKVFPAFSTMISKQSKTSYIQGWSRSITAALKQNMSKNVLGTSCSWFKIPVDSFAQSLFFGGFTEISGVKICQIVTGDVPFLLGARNGAVLLLPML